MIHTNKSVYMGSKAHHKEASWAGFFRGMYMCIREICMHLNIRGNYSNKNVRLLEINVRQVEKNVWGGFD